MDFLVVPLPENVFADFAPTIVVSNGGDGCDGASLKRRCVLQRARGLHFMQRGSVIGRNVVSLLVNRPSEVAVKARQHVSCLTVWITGFVRWKVVYCHIQSIDLGKQKLSQPTVVLFACFVGVHSLISCQLRTCCPDNQ